MPDHPEISPIDGIIGISIRLLDCDNLVCANDATGIVVITQVQPISVVGRYCELAYPSVKKLVIFYRNRRR